MSAYLAYLRDEVRAALGGLGLAEAPLDAGVDRALRAGLRRLAPVLGAETVDVRVPAEAVSGACLDLEQLVDDFGELRGLRGPGGGCGYEPLSRTQVSLAGGLAPQAGAWVRLTYVKRLSIEGLRGAVRTNFDETVEPAVVAAAVAEYLESVGDAAELRAAKSGAHLHALAEKVWARAVQTCAHRQPSVVPWSEVI